MGFSTRNPPFWGTPIYGNPLYVWDVFKWNWFWEPPKTNSWHGPFKELPAWNGLKLRKPYWLHLSTSLVFRHSSFYATQKTLLQSHKLLHKSAVKRIVGIAYWIYMLNSVLNIVASMAVWKTLPSPFGAPQSHLRQCSHTWLLSSNTYGRRNSNIKSIHFVNNGEMTFKFTVSTCHYTARSYPWIYPCQNACVNYTTHQ